MGSMRPARAIAPLALCVLLAAALVQPLTLPSAHAAAPIRMGDIGILRYYNRASADPRVRDEVITILAAHTPVKDRAVYDKMIWPGLNPNGTIAPRTMLDFERWLPNTRQITEFVTPSRFVDESFTLYAAKVLGPTAP